MKKVHITFSVTHTKNYITSTSKEVDFLHLRKERIDLDDSIKNERITF